MPEGSLRWLTSAALAPYPRLHRPIQKLYNLPAKFLAHFRPSEQQLLSDIARRMDDVFFVQIGANDGKTEDYLYDFVCRGGWRGILVEPVRPVFEKLQRNYRDVPDLTFENVAISDGDGLLPSS
jgi:hypothetical protein